MVITATETITAIFGQTLNCKLNVRATRYFGFGTNQSINGQMVVDKQSGSSSQCYI